jgi:uncharacterized sporulation protein YeaH/YhbH (DUF444 family)
MATIIDRRKNSTTTKNLSNRQRFIKRAKEQIKKAVQDSIQSKKIDSMGKDDTVRVPVKDLNEPEFRHASNEGFRDMVYNGNKDFMPKDQIKKPQNGQGKGGKEGSDSGSGEDEFVFELNREEFLDIFFEDLELPDMIKESLKDTKKVTYQRCGFTNVGSPSNIDVRKTACKALSRRISLNRPSKDDEQKLLEERTKLYEQLDHAEDDDVQEIQTAIKIIEDTLASMKSKMISVPWIDPMDVRYRNYLPKPKPVTQAVVFCIMDISGSMGEHEKDIAKRFFLLLYFFLQRKYEKIDIVFISHTQDAKEVTEEEFFNSRENGGTVVSSALELMSKIIKDRYPLNDWNIYGAQASDGDNFYTDSVNCIKIMENDILPKVQYMAYLEVKADTPILSAFRWSANGTVSDTLDHESDLWKQYKTIAPKFKNFEMTIGANRQDIFSVFRKLFSKEKAKG